MGREPVTDSAAGHGAATRRALPTHMLDLVRDGVPSRYLRERGDRAIWSALVKVAASAQQAGHAYSDFVHLLGQARSALGRQASTDSRMKELSPLRVQKRYRAAWDAAANWLATAPPPITADDAREHAQAILRAVEDADAQLTDGERAVLHQAAVIAIENGTTRPAMPRHRLVARTGLGERTVRTALRRLHDAGVLVCEDPGRSGDPRAVNPRTGRSRARAALYRLPLLDALNAYLYRGTRSVGPPAQVYGTPAPDPTGTPTRPMGPPALSAATDEETAVPTLTLTAPTPEALAAIVRALAHEPAVAVVSAPPQLHLVRDDEPGPRAEAR